MLLVSSIRERVFVFDTAFNYSIQRSNSNTRKWCEICSESTIKTSEQRQSRRRGVFIVAFNFERISHLFLVFLLK